MDRITKNLLNDFLNVFSFSATEESEDFERFCNYCVLSKEYSDTFDVQDITVSGGADMGIDGLAILVNGRLVDDEEEVDDLRNMNTYLDVTYVFVQAKTSSHFETGAIGTFIFGVTDFFSEQPKLIRNEQIKRKASLSDYIFKKYAAAMTRRNPICKLYYVTTGIWNDEPDLRARVSAGEKDIMQMNLFQHVEVIPVGVSQLQQLYRSTKEKVAAEIEFSNKILLPPIEGVKEAYLGTLPATEYLKLISDQAGNIRKSVFYDNIRDFQGDNEVNKEIEQTLESDAIRKFTILNNGVTIISKTLTTVANRFNLRDYQIVNGCQTSHVLFNCKDSFEGHPNILHIPIKIVVTSDEEITNSVIKATNRQTAVKTEEFEALNEFQKKLESYYETFAGQGRLYYERRSRQYNDSPGIERTRVVTIPIQIRAFAAMFLDQPHRVGRYYGSLTSTIRDKLFQKDHEPAPYHTSALAYYRLDYLFRNFGRPAEQRVNCLDSKYRKFKWHLLTILRYQILGTELPRFNSKKINTCCDKITKILEDPDKSAETFGNAAKIIDRLGLADVDRDSVKSQAVLTQMLASMRTG